MCSTSDDRDDEKIKHREKERVRYRQILRLINELKSAVPGLNRRRTQASIVQNASLYCIYLMIIRQKMEKRASTSCSCHFCTSGLSANGICMENLQDVIESFKQATEVLDYLKSSANEDGSIVSDRSANEDGYDHDEDVEGEDVCDFGDSSASFQPIADYSLINEDE